MNKKYLLLVLAFLATIVAANYVTTVYGMIPVGFGYTATAGTYLAGLMFVLRDSLQDSIRRKRTTTKLVQTYRSDWAERYDRQPVPPSHYAVVTTVLLWIVVGAVLSFLLSDPFIALASGVAFLVSEALDLLVYTPLREKGYMRAALASNVVGAVADTFLFLWIAGFPIAGAWQGQIVGKLTVTAVALAAVWVWRFRPRAVELLR